MVDWRGLRGVLEELYEDLEVFTFLFLLFTFILFGVLHALSGLERAECEALTARVYSDKCVYEELRNETNNFHIYGCVHWAEAVAGSVARKCNVSSEEVFNAVWCAGYLYGKNADSPYTEQTFKLALILSAVITVLFEYTAIKLYQRKVNR